MNNPGYSLADRETLRTQLRDSLIHMGDVAMSLQPGMLEQTIDIAMEDDRRV